MDMIGDELWVRGWGGVVEDGLGEFNLMLML